MRSSRESRPTWIPGLNLLMYIERVPNDSTSLVTATSIPAIAEAMTMTVHTPMMTPMMVRNERSLFPRNVASASQRFSEMSERNSFINSPLARSGISAQSLNRVKTRGFPRRKQPGKNAGQRRDAQRQRNRADGKISLHEDLSHNLADDPCEKYSNRAANGGQGDRLGQELLQNIHAPGAERFAQADLLGPLGHCHQHNI